MAKLCMTTAGDAGGADPGELDGQEREVRSIGQHRDHALDHAAEARGHAAVQDQGRDLARAEGRLAARAPARARVGAAEVEQVAVAERPRQGVAKRARVGLSSPRARALRRASKRAASKAMSATEGRSMTRWSYSTFGRAVEPEGAEGPARARATRVTCRRRHARRPGWRLRILSPRDRNLATRPRDS